MEYYKTAFSRNIGIISKEEQKHLADYKIAIPGMGGVGGAHLISYLRCGFSNFHIADYDTFELANINRQYGANMTTLGQKKAEVMKKMALEINPNCNIKVFPKGINKENLEEFLEGVDLSVDSLDAFAIDIRRRLINYSHEKNIPLISAGPIGYGSAYAIFMPNGPNFDNFFGVNDKTSENEMLAAFFIGLIPKYLQGTYMTTDLENRNGPSLKAGIDVATAVTLTNSISILTDGKPSAKPVPYVHQSDFKRNKHVSTKVNHKSPILRFKRKLFTDILDKKDYPLLRFVKKHVIRNK